jgi:hypothetical protein
MNTVGVITLCWHCGYACQFRHYRWKDDETGEWYEGDFWDHFADNEFTCHTAAPKISVRERWAMT